MSEAFESVYVSSWGALRPPPIFLFEQTGVSTIAHSDIAASNELVIVYEDFQRVQQGDYRVIGDFPGEPYAVTVPIPVKIEWTGSDFLARFDEANIAMTGATRSEALGNLAGAILDTFEDYSAEAALGPEPARQLAVLRRHIAKR